MNEKNYYKILQVDPAASTEQIKAAYRRLAFIYHPDQTKDAGTSPQMQTLNEAFAVLSDPGRRAEYDQSMTEPATGEVVRTERPATPAEATETAPEPDGPAGAPMGETTARRKRAARSQAWLRKQLKLIFQVTILVTILFIWSLFTGRISLPVIGLLVMISLVVVFSIVREIRNR